MEEYIKTLLEQVRCKKAHALIEGEIRGHMEEQMEANLAEGMPEEEAVRAAVNDMGDAVEVGIALDRVHRPEMAWDMVILVAVISIIAIALHVLPDKNIQGAGRFALFTVVGFVMMLVVYRIDYSFMAKLILGYLGDCHFIGGSGFSDGMVPDVACSHILIYLMVSYGIAAGLAICGILILLSIKVFKISVKQKNQLGMMMGCGCGMAFASNILFNIFGNTGLFLSAATFLPFFSSGGCNIVVSYILVGIIMSVYRYKNVFPKHFKLEHADS